MMDKLSRKKHLETFDIMADLSTSAIASYALGYAVIKDPANGVERVCTWIERHWNEFDTWQQTALIESCEFHEADMKSKRYLVARLITWMKATAKRPDDEALAKQIETPKPAPNHLQFERKLCR